MKSNIRFILSSLFVSLALAFTLPACDSEVGNLNDLNLEEFEQSPTASTLRQVAVGLIVGNRAGKAGGNGLVTIVGVLGREAYNFDPADPRYVTELLEGAALDGGSPAFGGNFFFGPYRNIRQTFLVERGLDVVSGLTESEIAATRGFSKTIRAMEFLTLVTTRWDTDIPIDVDRGINDELAPLEPRVTVLQHIADLLDSARTDLEAGGASFPFPLGEGYAGFDTPASYVTFNRGLRARVAAYQEDWATVLSALDESFISDDPANFDVGVYHAYSTGAGDVINGLSSEVIYVHPAVGNNVELKSDGEPDDRYTNKVYDVDPFSVTGALGSYSSSQRFAAYASNIAPLAILRNEELILLRAEANIGLGDYAAALPDINLIRTGSGGLDPIASLDANNALDELLQQRFYSLLFEGGHRWIDMRRFDRLQDLRVDDENDELTANATFPLPVAETDARPELGQ